MSAPAAPLGDLITRLGLVPHPEGGFYRETWRAPEALAHSALPARFAGPRAFGSAILFLLPAHAFSALHTIAGDEIWCFHLGDPLLVHTLDEAAPGGRRLDHLLGPDPTRHALQCVVPHGVTFGARVAPGGAWSLVSCIVVPGFDFADFTMPSRDALLARFPAHAELVTALTQP